MDESDRTFAFAPRHLLMVLLAAAGLSLASCNTIEGVGKDIEAAGDAIDDAASDDDDLDD